MSCVPFEQHTFEYGPRDYLNQLMSLISTLRGGQQRYLPLLLAKISDTVPSMPMSMPGYAVPAAPGSSMVDELYEGSQTQSSAPNSGESTPFGSPPSGAIDSQAFGFAEMGMGPSSTSAAFPVAMMTGIQYCDLATSAALQIMQDSAMHGYPEAAGPTKYEIG